MITPIEIRKAIFDKSFRGYSVEEVSNFLEMVSLEFEKQIEEYKRVKGELEKTQASYNSLKEVEGMLHKTLQQAEQSTKDTLDNARKRASLIVSEAESKAREIVRQGAEERNRIDKEILELCERRDEILMQLTLFLKTQTDRLSNFGRKTGSSHTVYLIDNWEKEQNDNLFATTTQIKSPEELTNVDDIVEQL